MSKKDYYEVLGLPREADDQQIKAAYRKLALAHHPDRNPNNPTAEEKFKEAAEAYSVLSDPQKRSSYDRFGHQGVQGAAQPGFDPNTFADFGDILGDFFGFGDLFGGSGGGGRRRQRAQRGEDVRYDLEIEFQEAVFGKAAELQVPRMEVCDRCQGSRAEPGSGSTTCPTCRGRGEVLYQQSFLTIRRTCGSCGGSGKIVRNPCTQCRGEGYRQVTRKLKVNIPAGVDDGTRMRLSHEGQPGANGGPPGDLYVVLHVKEHPLFEREGNDLHCTVPVNVAQAALGDEVDVPTLDGPERLKVPEGTQNGAKFRLRGKGVPDVNGGSRGDLWVHVDVKIPTRLSKEQKKLFEQLGETLPTEFEPGEKGLFDKVKDYFM
ncbi:MAG TPA: molecular chaperone DnaJ [Bryobacteraceae bacterium]|nr:molecular chaperone DnaJ [Bryobacteraceae bacterium]